VDRDLVIRAREGDHDAFARLAAASIGRLNALARLLLSDYARAEDAVQDAFVDAWRDIPALRDPERFDAWLNRLLVRACQNVRRRDRRRTSIELPIATDGPASPDAQARVADAELLERGLRRLTLEQRSVLVLTFYLDLSQADAAATLGVPIGTLKSRLSRAIDALRAEIAADERRPAQQAERVA
jgi:RNA polymerase sigma-70 factor (ECF subfamily)